MKIEVKDVGEFEVKDISYKNSRYLYEKNTKIFLGKTEEEIDIDQYYKFLEEVRVMSGIKEDDLKKYSMPQVDTILQTVLMEYVGINPKS